MNVTVTALSEGFKCDAGIDGHKAVFKVQAEAGVVRGYAAKGYYQCCEEHLSMCVKLVFQDMNDEQVKITGKGA